MVNAVTVVAIWSCTTLMMVWRWVKTSWLAEPSLSPVGLPVLRIYLISICRESCTSLPHRPSVPTYRDRLSQALCVHHQLRVRKCRIAMLHTIRCTRNRQFFMIFITWHWCNGEYTISTGCASYAQYKEETQSIFVSLKKRAEMVASTLSEVSLIIVARHTQLVSRN